MNIVKNGGNEWFERMYRKYYGRVYRFFRRDGIQDSEASDLAQDTFVRLYEGMSQYRGEAEWGYLETIARRVLFNWIRKGKAVKRNAPTVDIDDPEVKLDPPAAEEPDYAEREESELHCKQLREAIRELPTGQRGCQELRMDGMSYEEIAQALGISLDAVRSRLRDAKKFLMERLGDGGTLTEDQE